MLGKIEITAHRGSSKGAPENTLSALRLAIAEGADYAEVDIQQTQDGRLVLLHDRNLCRVAGVDRNVWELSYDQLRRLEVGSWFAPEFAGEKIPPLEDAIAIVRGKLKLNLELKVSSEANNLARQVIDLLEGQNFIQDCIISCSDYPTLQIIRKIAPKISLGLIISGNIANVDRFNVDFYSVAATDATRDFIQFAHSNNRKVHVWTVNEISQMQKLINLGIDNLITDLPTMAKTLK
jgi:glycerophosphoryl diester phosphodiesterase